MTPFVVTLFPFRHQVTVNAGDVMFAADAAHDLVPDATHAVVARLDDKPVMNRDNYKNPTIWVLFR